MTFLVEPPFMRDFPWLCWITRWYMDKCPNQGPCLGDMFLHCCSPRSPTESESKSLHISLAAHHHRPLGRPDLSRWSWIDLHHFSYLILILPSGNDQHSYGKWPWPFSIAMLDYQRIIRLVWDSYCTPIRWESFQWHQKLSKCIILSHETPPFYLV